MADWVQKKLNNVNYVIKLILVAVIGGFLLRFATGKSVTVDQFVEAVASTPVYLIIVIELLDKLSDKVDYEFLGFAYGSKYGVGKVTMSILIAGIGFVGVLYLMTGTIAFTTGAYNLGVLLAAGIYALYIIAPETGDDELIIFLWLAAQVATGGAFLGQALSLPQFSING